MSGKTFVKETDCSFSDKLRNLDGVLPGQQTGDGESELCFCFHAEAAYRLTVCFSEKTVLRSARDAVISGFNYAG